jgi:hypothetical protein
MALLGRGTAEDRVLVPDRFDFIAQIIVETFKQE